MLSKILIDLSIKKKIGLIVSLIGLIAFIGLILFLKDALQTNSHSLDMDKANKASDLILLANGKIAQEQGATSIVLANPKDAITNSNISSLRNEGDSYLDSALVLIKELVTDNELASKRLTVFFEIQKQRNDFRTKADEILTKTEAHEEFIKSWIKVQTELIMKSNELASSLFVPSNRLEKVFEYNRIVKNTIFNASEYAGRERATLGLIIGIGKPITLDQLNTLMKYRGVVEQNLDVVLNLKNDNDISPLIKDAINNMENLFVHDYQQIRESVYEASKNQTPYPITTAEWIKQSTTGINSILKVSETVSADANKFAEQQTNNSQINLLLSVITFIGLVLFILIAIYIARLIILPVKKLANVVGKVSGGDLNQTIDYTACDEIGSLSSSFNIMLQNIRKADHDLHLEKSNVERRVEEAIKESEDQRLYLEKSTEKILIEMNKFSNGDLSAHLESERNDNMSKLFDGFNKVVENIAKIIKQVIQTVDSTVGVSNQISSGSEEMAAGAQEQSFQTSEVASAVEQMTRTIFDTTQNASKAAVAAKNAGAIAKEGGEVVQKTIYGMNQVATVVSKSAEMVHDLGRSSDQIGEIIQVIDDIADQTNLLALNAAIEAARAGEQGRGFAVVADEVKKLAERTTKATKEIAVMIKQIQKDTTEAVEAMHQGTAEVEKGKELADQAGHALQAIINGSQEVVDMITQVAAASEEQSSAAEQISKNIDSINNVTQESTLGIRQIAVASDTLNNLTVKLHEMISKFSQEAIQNR